MSKKLIIIAIALAISLAPLTLTDPLREPAAGAVPTRDPVRFTYRVTVEVDSIQVISYLDEQGNERRPDSTLTPPVPLSGPREIRVAVGRAGSPGEQVAGRVAPK